MLSPSLGFISGIFFCSIWFSVFCVFVFVFSRGFLKCVSSMFVIVHWGVLWWLFSNIYQVIPAAVSFQCWHLWVTFSCKFGFSWFCVWWWFSVELWTFWVSCYETLYPVQSFCLDRLPLTPLWWRKGWGEIALLLYVGVGNAGSPASTDTWIGILTTAG